MSMVQQAIEVGAPLHTVYEQLATFENYPRFMSGVQQVTPIGENQTHWVMELDGQRREFDAQIIERTLDRRVAWSTTEGPRLAETITLRPMGETRTQVVAQLEADATFLLPGGRHGKDALTKRLKDDLTTFKGLVESGVMPATHMDGASSKRLSGRGAAVIAGGATRTGPVSPATVAARIKRRTDAPHPGAGWGPGRGPTDDAAAMGTRVDITTAPGIDSPADLDDVLAPGRRITRTATQSGSAPMGAHARTPEDRGDAMIHEEERGSAHDY